MYNVKHVESRDRLIGQFQRLILLILLAQSSSTVHAADTSQRAATVPKPPAAEISLSNDLDRDGLSDSVEARLGTDPSRRDTDLDGLSDYFEVYRLTLEGTTSGLPDADRDSIPAVIDPDDNGNGIHDGDEDYDEDGISNRLEYYGFVWENNIRIKQWFLTEGDQFVDGPYFDEHGDRILYFKTDPTQVSTDQDPYWDGEEPWGINMDKTVEDPGAYPTAPAAPEVYVTLHNYRIHPRATITSTHGKAIHDAWSSTTSTETFSESNWSASKELQSSPKGWSGKLGVSGGHSWGTRSTVVESESGFESQDWQQATTLNPSEAAFLELGIQYHNYGTATAHDLGLEFNLIIDGKHITTFRTPKEEAVAVLAPNQSFPPHVRFVGRESQDFLLTLDELRTIELGTPLQLFVNQVHAQIKRNTGNGWEEVDSWENYQPAIDRVTCRLTVELPAAEGADEPSMTTYRVYASEAADSGPEVRLRDALLWTVQSDIFERIQKGAPSKNYRVAFDNDALQEVKSQLEQGVRLLDIVLRPKWNISVTILPEDSGPQIAWASSDPWQRWVEAYVEDAYEIDRVRLCNTKTVAECRGPESIEMEVDPERSHARGGVFRVTLGAWGDKILAPGAFVQAWNENETHTEQSVHHVCITPHWMTSRGDSQRTGRSLLAGPDGKVESGLPKSVYRPGPPVVDGWGNAYIRSTNTTDSAIYIFGTSDHQMTEQGMIPLPGDSDFNGAIAIDENCNLYTVVTKAGESNLVAFDMFGSEVARHRVSGPAREIAPAKNGIIYVSSPAGIDALDTERGTVAHHAMLSVNVHGKHLAVDANGHAVVRYTNSSNRCRLRMLNSQAKEMWSADAVVGNDWCSSSGFAIGPDNNIYVSQFKNLRKFQSSNGRELKHIKLSGKHMQDLVIDRDGSLYTSQRNRRIMKCDADLHRCSEFADLDKLFDQYASHSLAMDKHGRLFLSADRRLLAIDQDGTKVLLDVGSPVSPLAIVPNGVVVGESDASVYYVRD